MKAKELPEGWEWKRLGEIGKIYSGSTPSTSNPDFFDGEIPWITPADLSDFQGVFIEKGKRNITQQGLQSSSVQMLPKDTILFSSRAPIGYVAIAANPLTTNQGFKNLVLREGIDPKYVFYYLKTHRREMQKFGSGTTFLEISAARFSKIPIILPPLPIQRQVVAVLEQAEALKRQRMEADALTGALLQSVFYEMFGDPVRNEKGWPLRSLKEIASPGKNSVKAGPFGSSLKKDCYTETGYKIYGQEQVIRDDLTYGNYFIPEEKFQELNDYQIQAGDILISLVGSYGKISVVPQEFEKGIINPRLMKITLNQNLMLPIFFKFLFMTEGVSNQIANLSHGGTMDIINVGIVKQLRFPLPPLALQQQFARVVEDVERVRQRQVESGKAIEGLCEGLMARGFSGTLNA